VEDKDGNNVDPNKITEEMKNNDGSPANFKDINDMLHIFFVRHLNNTNDPNTATNLLEYGEKDKQMEFLKI